MIPLNFKKFEIRKPRYDPNPEKSKTNNSKWRVGLFIIFEDYQGNEYDYMPKWDECAELNRMKDIVEELNKDLARQHIGDSKNG